jgi:protein-L-isoaspartate(D-aspartate) O-methyltransferase
MEAEFVSLNKRGLAMPPAPEILRQQMVDRLVAEGYIRTPAVEEALRAIPRHEFMPWASPEAAYDWQRTDPREEGHPSAPNVVAHWLELATLSPGQNVLEIGASTGYSAALTARLVGREGLVTSVEISPLRLAHARRRLAALGVSNINLMLADGYDGCPAHAPYDRILATAAPAAVPHAWLEQLDEGGILLVPFPLRGTYLSITLRLRREGASLAGSVASPIYLFWIEMSGRFTYWQESRLDVLGEHLRQLIARRGLPQTVPAPELREAVSMEINLLIFALLEFETRAISIPAFNVLGETDARRVVETILERWEALGRPRFWHLQARVQPTAAPPPPHAEYVIPRGDTTLYFQVPRGG